ncbi:putative receptor-like protein kinase At3g47110 isoform X1 [Papaver somniferum]|uniref:putative receptor-like protein kinase At3g47110 isoform X1 n=1 Tax=Papaver somniferum TaxID=3469 RepID=UPI000E6F6ACB|nr:putative receptor-like protein kinase At3g47110 isoform X1 [Papaver somniferum]
MFFIKMKMVPKQQLSLKYFNIELSFGCFILIISCMSMFVMDVSCLVVVHDNKSNDQLALLAFKDGITEDPLGTLSSWNSDNDTLHYCKWRGVTCSRRHPSRVTMLNLTSQRLLGSISPHIGNLSFLKYLNLDNNSLTGEIPHQLGRLSRLKYLSLTHNLLEGEIPQNISSCSNLIYLDFTHNHLVGRIPNELAFLSKLILLDLRENSLSGEIPASLGNLSSSLTRLSLSFNKFHGRIPSPLSQLTNLKYFDLSSNNLSGTVPSKLYNISSLIVFSLSVNQLHGSIPVFILPNLNYFSVLDNNFTGTFPTSFSNSTRLRFLQLGINNFFGSVPYNLGSLKNLTRLALGENNLGTGQANDLNFIDSIINSTNLNYLYLGINNFGGVLPISMANFSANLATLSLRNNQLYGSIPAGIQNLLGLTVFDFSDNLFTGSIPTGIGNLQNLGTLDLRRNKLSGSIPSSFGNLTRLLLLTLSFNNLTGSIPPSIGNCESLHSLSFWSNRLTGSIPAQVLKLPSLSRFLNLANNSLTGPVPAEVGNLKSLGVLDLSENKLSGEIPSTIGECIGLTSLELNDNFFHGDIPSAITFLKGLQILNLSHNNLSGALPKGLENLSTLLDLNLSYNNLEGEVPKDGVFKNTSAFSIQGNNKLCGGIPEIKLAKCYIPLKQKQKKSLSAKAISIVISFGVLFLTLMVVFLFCWRKKANQKLHPTALDLVNQFKGISYNELLKATNGFSDSTNLLGVGSFGSVYKGILREAESIPVAVKVLHLQQRGATKSFMAECDALREVRHRNLLKIVTCCTSTDFQGNNFKALVFEFMSNGSLEDWLHPSLSDTNVGDQMHVKNLNLKRRLNISVDVASALKYLHHDCKSPLVHCDLKPSNVLLDDDLTAHVGDFGLAKFLHKTSSNSQQMNEQDASSIAIKGSIGYVSPEYGMGGDVSTLGDVYSYGILLLQMFTGKRPTDDVFKDGLNIHKFSKMHASPERVLDIVDSRLLLEFEVEHLENTETNSYNMPRCQRRNRARHTTREILASIIQIGVICSSELPSDRLSMNDIIVDVQAVKNQYLGIGM